MPALERSVCHLRANGIKMPTMTFCDVKITHCERLA
jgi:hypothetical protein